jgi:hypothetical protein
MSQADMGAYLQYFLVPAVCHNWTDYLPGYQSAFLRVKAKMHAGTVFNPAGTDVLEAWFVLGLVPTPPGAAGGEEMLGFTCSLYMVREFQDGGEWRQPLWTQYYLSPRAQHAPMDTNRSAREEQRHAMIDLRRQHGQGRRISM